LVSIDRSEMSYPKIPKLPQISKNLPKCPKISNFLSKSPKIAQNPKMSYPKSKMSYPKYQIPKCPIQNPI
jgi:hypothetical protein